MKLLAVSLLRDPKIGIQIKHRFLDVEKETQTGYKIHVTEKSSILVSNRTHIKKDELDKIVMHEPEKKNALICESCISLSVWVLIEQDTPQYDLLRYWRKKIKDIALDEIKKRNQSLKNLYYELAAL